jgi:hypothetical protein
VGVLGDVTVGGRRLGCQQLGVDIGCGAGTAGTGAGPGRRGGTIVTPGRRGINTSGAQDLVDDVGLLAPRIRVERHRVSDGSKLLALFTF